MESIPQTEKFLLDNTIAARTAIGTSPMPPQVGIGTGIKECGEQTLAEDFLHRLLHLRRQIVAAQAVQVVQVGVYLSGIGHRAVNIVEVADDDLRPIDEFVKRLSPVTHHAAIGVIEGKYHLNVGSGSGVRQLGEQVVDGGHPRQQMRTSVE